MLPSNLDWNLTSTSSLASTSRIESASRMETSKSCMATTSLSTSTSEKGAGRNNSDTTFHRSRKQVGWTSTSTIQTASSSTTTLSQHQRLMNSSTRVRRQNRQKWSEETLTSKSICWTSTLWHPLVTLWFGPRHQDIQVALLHQYEAPTCGKNVDYIRWPQRTLPTKKYISIIELDIKSSATTSIHYHSNARTTMKKTTRRYCTSPSTRTLPATSGSTSTSTLQKMHRLQPPSMMDWNLHLRTNPAGPTLPSTSRTGTRRGWQHDNHQDQHWFRSRQHCKNMHIIKTKMTMKNGFHNKMVIIMIIIIIKNNGKKESGTTTSRPARRALTTHILTFKIIDHASQHWISSPTSRDKNSTRTTLPSGSRNTVEQVHHQDRACQAQPEHNTRNSRRTSRTSS